MFGSQVRCRISVWFLLSRGPEECLPLSRPALAVMSVVLSLSLSLSHSLSLFLLGCSPPTFLYLFCFCFFVFFFLSLFFFSLSIFFSFSLSMYIYIYFFFGGRPQLVGTFWSKISIFPQFYSKNWPRKTPTKTWGFSCFQVFSSFFFLPFFALFFFSPLCISTS